MKLIVLTAALAAALSARPARAQDQTFSADNGPDSIDVSKYPKDQQEAYKVFAQKCSTCHTLARPINIDYATPAEWDKTVNTMRHKPHAGISEDTAKTIENFLIYDSSVRKKSLLAQKEKAAGSASAAPASPAPSSAASAAAPATTAASTSSSSGAGTKN